jgi:hypothetical protein
MKKLTFVLLLVFCSVFVHAQEAMVLDDAILDAVNFFSTKLQSRTTVAITNFEAETKDLSDFIIQELSVAFANTGNVRVVERRRLEMLQSELNFNMSGSVSDETAQGIGRMIGAQILFSGSIIQYRDMYRMRVQAIVVETAEVIGTRTINVKYDPTLTGLLKVMNPADAWKYQWLYAGVNVGYSATIKSPTIYGYEDDQDDYYAFNVPLGFAVYAIVQPFDLFGVAIDFGGNMYEGFNISVLPTLVLRPSWFEVDVFLGVGINTTSSTESNIAYVGGVRGGVHAGPGVVFAEIRPMGWVNYDAFFVNFTLGYQIGFIPRKNKS